MIAAALTAPGVDLGAAVSGAFTAIGDMAAAAEEKKKMDEEAAALAAAEEDIHTAVFKGPLQPPPGARWRPGPFHPGPGPGPFHPGPGPNVHIKKSEIEAAFKAFDTDGSGFLEPKEIRAILVRPTPGRAPLTEPEADAVVKKFIDKYDKNGDGKLEIGEISEYLAAHREAGPPSRP